MNTQKAIVMNNNRPLDELNPSLIRAKKKVSDLTIELAKAISDLEAVMADVYYRRAFEDGVDSAKEEINRVLNSSDEPESVQVKPYVLTEIDRIMNDSIISYVTSTPGVRTIDITNKVITIPVKPMLTEKSIRLAINRLKNTNKIEDKAGRWYVTGAKPPAQDFKVMRYMEDGTKYLAADIIK